MGKLIAFMGMARSGKDTAADYLQQRYDFKKIAFAERLKNACREIFGFDHSQLYGETKEVVDEFWGKTPREILQFVGTDLFRDNFDQQIWVKALERYLKDGPECDYVITDCRFKNEFEAVKGMGGQVWKLVRTDGPGASGGIAQHPSEVELNSIDENSFDAVIKVPTGAQGLLDEVEKTYGRLFSI